MKGSTVAAASALTVLAIGGWHFVPHLGAQSPPRAPAAKVIIVPPGMDNAYDGMRYAPAVRVGEMVMVSGIPAGGPGSYEDQVRRMFGRISAILSAAGATMEDVVELQSFHTVGADEGAFNDDFKRFSTVHREVFPSHYPAWTATGNATLLARGARVEVRVVAMVGSGRNATIQRGAQ